MDIKNYIKVTPKGETRSHVVLAANKAFYAKHGAKIEEPTEEEVLNAFPELKGSELKPLKMAISNEVTEQLLKERFEENNRLIAEIKEKDEQILSLISGREADADKKAELNARCEELVSCNTEREAKLASSNELVNNLSNDLTKANETIAKLNAVKK